MRTNKIESDLSGFREIVKTSFSFNDVRRKLGYKPSGGIYKYLKIACVTNNISTKHFTGQLWSKGKTSKEDERIEQMASKKRLEFNDVFCENSPYRGSNQMLLKRLVKEGHREYKCEVCGIFEWMNNPLVLQLDHINGNNTDNQIKNLRIICPNCHTQTPTFGKRKQFATVS